MNKDFSSEEAAKWTIQLNPIDLNDLLEGENTDRKESIKGWIIIQANKRAETEAGNELYQIHIIGSDGSK